MRALWVWTVVFTVAVPFWAIVTWARGGAIGHVPSLVLAAAIGGIPVLVYRFLSAMVDLPERPALPAGPVRSLQSVLDEVVRRREAVDVMEVQVTGETRREAPGAAIPVEPSVPVEQAAPRSQETVEEKLDAPPVQAAPPETGKEARKESPPGAKSAAAKGRKSPPADKSPATPVLSGTKVQSVDAESVSAAMMEWMRTLGEATVAELTTLLRRPKQTVHRWLDEAVADGRLEREQGVGKTGRTWYRLKEVRNETPYPGSHRMIANGFVVWFVRWQGGEGVKVGVETAVAEGIRCDRLIDIAKTEFYFTRIYVEADRGTERPVEIAEKIEAYRTTLGMLPRAQVVFVSETRGQAQTLAQAATDRIRTLGRSEERVFFVGLDAMKEGGGAQNPKGRTLGGRERGLLDGGPEVEPAKEPGMMPGQRKREADTVGLVVMDEHEAGTP